MATINVTLPSDGTTADVADYNTPITTIVNEINGNLDNANIKSAAAISGSKLADNSIDIEAKASTDSGWREVTDSWAYASATTITVPTDATTKYSVGDKIRLTQTTVKYFYIVAVAATTLTITGGTDYTLANAAISDISYSKASSPLGFPQWFAYTPTVVGLSAVASSTLAAKFSLIGKTAHYRVQLTLGGTNVPNASDVTFTPPISFSSGYVANDVVGTGSLTDAGTETYEASVLFNSSVFTVRTVPANTTYSRLSQGITSTVPFTWVATDRIQFAGSYEVA